MKKIMVMTIVITMLATSAFAVIRNTKHDLSSTSGQTVASDNYSETCVFCHTPHGGQTGILAPLWNRSHLGKDYSAPSELYNSVTLTSYSTPSTVEGAVTRSDAKLCMSCHDGTNLNGGLLNPANSSLNAQPIFTGVTSVRANANLGDDLTNDHPIGMDYRAAQGADGDGLNTDNGGASGAQAVGVLPLYADSAATNDVMWCSTCHDVHGSAYTPFLNMDNAGSKMCTTCHNK